MITALEELAVNAWPALQTLHYDGWVLRFAEGYTKRANAVHPLYPGVEAIEPKIEFCECVYQEKGQNVVFKMTSGSSTQHLDRVLSDRGYIHDSLTSVQTLTLDGVGEKVNLGCATMESTASETWLTTCCQMNQINDRNKGILQRMLGNIIPAKCFATIYHDDTVVACGLGVRQGEHVGLFDLVVHPSYRGQGYGTQLVLNLLAWGRQGNARRAYLQVMLNNSPALHLYQKVGFREQYQYWYRIKS